MILLISLINFINFYFSIASSRTKSIAIRRIMGETIMGAKLTILIECIMLFIICFGLSVVSILVFNDLGFMEIDMTNNISILMLIFFSVIVLGYVMGLMYSRYLVAEQTSFSMLYTKIKRKSAFAKMLVIFQFFISFVLIVISTYMITQMRFIDKKEVGYEKDSIITFDISNDIAGKYELLRAELLKISDVADVAFSADKFATLDYYGSLGRQYRDGNINFDVLMVSQNFLDVMGIKVTDGRNFIADDYRNSGEQSAMTYIFNEKAKSMYDLVPGEMVDGVNIAGISADYNVMSLRKAIRPTALVLFRQGREWVPLTYAFCKVSGSDITRITSEIRSAIHKFDPSLPVDFSLFSNDLNRAYAKENTTTFSMVLFSIISIIIALMGVVGQLLSEVKSRVREIAIRKVYGSTQKQIFSLFNNWLLKIALIGFAVSLPFSYLAIMIWRMMFEYSISLNIWIYIVSLIFVLILVTFVVTSICWKYSKQNPVTTLNK